GAAVRARGGAAAVAGAEPPAPVDDAARHVADAVDEAAADVADALDDALADVVGAVERAPDRLRGAHDAAAGRLHQTGADRADGLHDLAEVDRQVARQRAAVAERGEQLAADVELAVLVADVAVGADARADHSRGAGLGAEGPEVAVDVAGRLGAGERADVALGADEVGADAQRAARAGLGAEERVAVDADAGVERLPADHDR